jgi:LysM repeat protein
MIGNPLSPRRRSRSGPAILVLVIIAILVILALSKFRSGEPGDNAQLAFVLLSTETATRIPSATPMPTNSPTPSATQAPATHTPTVAAPLVTAADTYEVLSGDTLGGIAREFDVSVAEIAQANEIETDAILRVGQTLVIPATIRTPTIEAPASPANSSPATPVEKATPDGEVILYEVQAGDVLSSIASEFNVSMNTIIEENDLENPEMLRVGDELRIPLGTPTPLPTPTLIPTPTSTSGPPLPAPVPLGPSDGETISGEYALLNWSAVDILDANEWYLVQLWIGEAPNGFFMAEEWTQTTSWRVPAALSGVESAGLYPFYWYVIVAQRNEGDGDAGWSWDALSSESEVRVFIWRRDEPPE